jgi:hypothetical protein
MKSDKLGKQFLKALHQDRKQIVQHLADIDHKIEAFGGKKIGRQVVAPDARVDVRAGRKLTAAHRKAIREGIRKARAKKAGAEKK